MVGYEPVQDFGSGTFWSLVTVRLPSKQWRFMEATVPSQEIVPHIATVQQQLFTC